MKFTILPILVTFILSLSVFPQSRSRITQPSTTKTETCKLDIKQSPALRGIKLGMSPSEVSAKLNMQIPSKEGTFFLNLTGRYAESEIQYLLNENDSIAKTILVNLNRKIDSVEDKLISVSDGSKIAEIRPTPEQKKTDSFEEIVSISLKYYDGRLISIHITYSTNKFETSTKEEFYKEMFSLLNLPLTESNAFGYVSCADFVARVLKFESGLAIFLDDTSSFELLRRNAIQSVRDLYENEKKRVNDLEREKAEKKGFKP